MGLLDVIILGVALSADAFAVTVSNSFAYSRETIARKAMMPVMFGLFQGLMPLLGYFLGGLAADLIERYAGIVTLVILGIIGGNMIHEGVAALREGSRGPDGELGQADSSEENDVPKQRLTVATLTFQAVATAIDAFAVGVSLRAMGVPIVSSASIIALTTAICCTIALFVGHKLGDLLGDRAEVVGGIVLVIIGLRAFFA
ncbi:MAG: manganese efflux pump MntP family protein [Coriobacteriales bacterium]|nr:manganese efflux pump MntP family protein [Coriobacteriales bacterium]